MSDLIEMAREEIWRLKGEINRLKGAINGLERELVQKNNLVDNLYGEIDQYKAAARRSPGQQKDEELIRLESEVDRLKGETRLEAEINRLEAALNQKDSLIDSLYRELDIQARGAGAVMEDAVREAEDNQSPATGQSRELDPAGPEKPDEDEKSIGGVGVVIAVAAFIILAIIGSALEGT